MAKPSQKATEIGLKTRHLFLDTQVYRQYGHNLNAKVLQSLLARIEDDVCTLHITDVTKAEIFRQVEELAQEVAQAVNEGNRELRRWHGKLPRKVPAHAEKDLDATAMAKEAISHLKIALSTSWKAVTHKVLDVPPRAIFESYFRREPPFDQKDSKEFPDAFVVAALDQWCQHKHIKMYVVTRDEAMKRAAERTKTLLSLSSLDDFLQIIVEAQHPDIVNRVQKLLNSVAWDEIEERIKEQLGSLGAVYSGSFYDGEIVDHYAGNEPFKLEDFHVISATDEEIEVVAKVRASVGFEVQYLDTTMATYDKEDDSYIGAEKQGVSGEEEATLSVHLVIDGKEDEVTDVDLLSRDLHLHGPDEEW